MTLLVIILMAMIVTGMSSIYCVPALWQAFLAMLLSVLFKEVTRQSSKQPLEVQL